MTQIMTPSAGKMTDGQIDKASDIFRAVLRKHRGELISEAVQQALGTDELGTELLNAFRKRVEAFGDMIVRRVKVNRNRSPEKMLKATNWSQDVHVTDSVIATMPGGEGDEEEEDVYFFVPRKSAYDKNYKISNDNLAKEYDFFGLKSDPYAQVAVNKADPAFVDEYPNASHWKDADGNWCYVTLDRYLGERHMRVCRGVNWGNFWFFAGIRK